MKIAFFSPAPFSKKLGATKNRMEMADALSKLGWETFLIGNEDLGLPGNTVAARPLYREHLKKYLIANGEKFDVVLYEYDTLPFDRSLFSSKTLLVARPALLHYHFNLIRIPYSLRSKISNFVRGIKVLFGLANPVMKIDSAEEAHIRKSLAECDVIQVQNTLDKKVLQEQKFSTDKIIIVPNGISGDRLKLFANSDRAVARTAPKIAFIGGFDYRKGAMDFPYIISAVLKFFPECKFKLIGTKGIFHTESKLLNFFPKKLRHAIEITHSFEPLELPEVLSDCSLGIFPTYIESFGFGALEMMAAGLPVISYSAPGPADFVLKELLVNIGDKEEMAIKILELLKDSARLEHLSVLAQNVANDYNWDAIGRMTAKTYTDLHQRLIDNSI